jgi:signal transduction histidine kinase
VLGTAVIGGEFLAVLTLSGLLSADLLLTGWVRFWIGDVVGILVTAPLLLVAIDGEGRANLAALMRRGESYLQIGLLIVTLIFLTVGIAEDPSDAFYLLFPPLIWIALRGGLAGAVVAIATVQLGIVIAFHQQAENTLPILELQALVVTLTLTGLYLGVIVDERQRAMERLNQSAHLAAAGEMAGAITHEVSQPLTALASYSRSAKLLIQAGRGDAELAGLIDKIFSESLRASQVVRRLRDFFRAGSMRLQPITAGELLEMARRVGSELTQGTDVSFGAEAEPDLPSISADRVQLELVMRNLISNAVDSLAEHETASGTVAVRIGRDGARRLDIVVADNGPGISAAAKASLFRPFISAKPNGMGIGLAVSRAIAEAHGGTLDDESRSHGQFRLVLPVEHTHA